MPEIGSAWVSILPSAKGFGSKLNQQVGGGVVSAGKSIGKAFGAAIVAGGAVAATAGALFLKSAISEAANLEQSIGAIDTVFKKSAGQMHQWGKQAATDVGLTRNEFNELGTLIGTQLRNGGTAMDELAPKTNKLIGLGADLSSMFGGTTKDAVAALSSALKGERDPIEAYGVSLNQAKIDAEAAALGFEKVGGSLSAEANQAATLSLIMKQTADAHGNFARETDTLAHKQQVLSAQFGNFKAQVGTALIPVIIRLLDIMEKRVRPALIKVAKAVVPVISAMRDKLEPVVKRVTKFFKENPEVMKGAAIGLGVLAVAIGAVSLAMGVLALATSPVTLLVVTVAALGAGIAYLWRNSETFRAVVLKVWAALQAFGAFVRDEIVPIIVDLGQKVTEKLAPVWRALAQFWSGTLVPVLTQVATKFKEWWPTIQAVIVVVAKLVAKAVELWASIQGKLLPILIRVGGYLLRTFVPIWLNVVSTIVKAIGRVVAFGKAMSDGGKKAGDLAVGVAATILKILGWMKALPGAIKTKLGEMGSVLYESGKSVIQGFWNGLKSKWDDVENWFGGVTSKIPKLKGPPARDRVLLRPAGRLVMEGFEDGLLDGERKVASRLAAITTGISATGSAQTSLAVAASMLGERSATSADEADALTAETIAMAVRDALHRMGLTLQIGKNAAGNIVLIGQNVVEARR